MEIARGLRIHMQLNRDTRHKEFGIYARIIVDIDPKWFLRQNSFSDRSQIDPTKVCGC